MSELVKSYKGIDFDLLLYFDQESGALKLKVVFLSSDLTCVT